MQCMASHIALALHNMRLYSSLSQLNETGQILTQQLVSAQTLQAIVDKIQEATKADLVILQAYEATRRQFVFPPRIAGSVLDSTIQSMHPTRPEDIAALVLRHGKPIFAQDSAILYHELRGNQQTQHGNFQEREKISSTVVVPLQVDVESIGVLFVIYPQPQHFDPTQKLFIKGLAHYAAIVMKNAQIFGTLSQRRLRELEILQRIDRELSRTLNLNSILHRLLKLA